MAKNTDVLSLIDGLSPAQAREFTAVIMPIMLQVKTTIKAGRRRVIIDLEELGEPEKHRRVITSSTENEPAAGR